MPRTGSRRDFIVSFKLLGVNRELSLNMNTGEDGRGVGVKEL
jgi:hypothetical protein